MPGMIGIATDADGGVSVAIARPHPDLQSYVTFFYVVECAKPLTDFLYPELGNVRFALSGNWMVRMPGFRNETPQTAALFGPTDRHGAITTRGGKCIGFGLTPIGWNRLIGSNASLMANRVVPLGMQLGVDGEWLRAQLIAIDDDAGRMDFLERAVRDLLAQRPPVDEKILTIDRALRTRPDDVVAFAETIGVSDRTLHRLCLHTFGFAPKRMMRLQRFLDMLGSVRSAVGAGVRASIGDDYYDQSHFYRDFRDFMAMSPRKYFRDPRHLMAAAAEAQVRADVTLSFRMPPQPGELGEALI